MNKDARTEQSFKLTVVAAKQAIVEAAMLDCPTEEFIVLAMSWIQRDSTLDIVTALGLTLQDVTKGK